MKIYRWEMFNRGDAITEDCYTWLAEVNPDNDSLFLYATTIESDSLSKFLDYYDEHPIRPWGGRCSCLISLDHMLFLSDIGWND
jgi:hypothetical protein